MKLTQKLTEAFQAAHAKATNSVKAAVATVQATQQQATDAVKNALNALRPKKQEPKTPEAK